MIEGEAKPKRRRESFVKRTGDRVRDAAGLGRLAFEQPRSLPGELGRRFKRFVRALFRARGGGLYACGFVVTFLWLEATTLVGQVASSSSLAAFLAEELLEFLFRFAVQSLVNTVLAFIWPVFVIELSPVYGAVALGALYLLFPRFIQPHIDRWLFDDEEEGATGESPQG
jgi:hypothetical protein